MRVCALWRAIIWETLLWWQKLRKHLTVLFESLETRRKHATQPKECVNVILHLSSAVSLASWLRESPIGSCESGTAKPSAKHFWQSCRLSSPSLKPSEPPIAKYPTSTQPIRRSATESLYLGRRFGPTPSQCLLPLVCRADPTIRGENAQRSKVRIGAVASLPCWLLGVREAQR